MRTNNYKAQARRPSVRRVSVCLLALPACVPSGCPCLCVSVYLSISTPCLSACLFILLPVPLPHHQPACGPLRPIANPQPVPMSTHLPACAPGPRLHVVASLFIHNSAPACLCVCLSASSSASFVTQAHPCWFGNGSSFEGMYAHFFSKSG